MATEEWIKESHTEWQAVRRPAPSCSDCAAGQRVEAQVRLLSVSFDEAANSRTLLCAGSICSQTLPQEPKVTILRSDILWKSPPFVITLAGSKSIAYRGACHGMTAWPAPAARSRSTMRTCCASTDTITGWAADFNFPCSLNPELYSSPPIVLAPACHEHIVPHSGILLQTELSTVLSYRAEPGQAGTD